MPAEDDETLPSFNPSGLCKQKVAVAFDGCTTSVQGGVICCR